MRRKSMFLCYFVSLTLIIGYILVFSLVFENDFTYSYKIYYVEAKTKYWYGYNGLQVNFGQSFYYEGKDKMMLNGLQYMGKDFDFIIETVDEGKKELTGIEITKSSTLYFEIIDEMDKYLIILETECKENNLTFLLNNQNVENFKYENGRYTLFIENKKKENVLNIKSIGNVKLNMLAFEEI